MVIGFSILRSQAVTRRSAAVALAACPQTRKRREDLEEVNSTSVR